MYHYYYRIAALHNIVIFKCATLSTHISYNFFLNCQLRIIHRIFFNRYLSFSQVCLKRSFSAKVYTCPMCRQDLEKNIIESVNDKLQKALLSLYPGYDAGR